MKKYQKKMLGTRFLSIFLAVAMIVTSGQTSWSFQSMAEESAGESIGADVIKISSIKDLEKIYSELDGDYILEKDLDFKGENFIPIGDHQNPFTGTFDGNGHVLSNLSIKTETAQKEGETIFAGVFGVMEYAQVKNLAIENIKILGSEKNGAYLGGITGKMKDSVVEDCYVKGKITVDGKFSLLFTGNVIYFSGFSIKIGNLLFSTPNKKI